MDKPPAKVFAACKMLGNCKMLARSALSANWLCRSLFSIFIRGPLTGMDMKPFALQFFQPLLLLLGLTCTARMLRGQGYYTIEVLDSITGRGVPMVEVSTAGQSFYTDSNGIVALNEPGLMNQSLPFEFKTYGYANTSQTLTTLPGNLSQIQTTRINRAERLYRATGPGIYQDSVLVSRSVPISQPLSNGNVLGQDSVQAAVYNDRIHWFWGDSLYENGGGIGGNYWTSGATSQLPSQGGLRPSVGIDLNYYEDALGQTRPMFPQYRATGKPVWVDGLFTVKDNSGQERLLTHFVNVQSLFPVFVLLEQGLAQFDDAAGTFVKTQDYGVAQEQVWGTGPPIVPAGHSFRHSTGGEDYIYFGENYPNIRVRDNWDAVNDISQWEAFTPLKENTRYNAANPPLDLDAGGKPIYGWKKNTDPLGTEIFEEMVTGGHLSRTEAPVGLVDFETGADVQLHRSSVHWNTYRRKWVMIGNESAGNGSFLGEVWYAEAPTPEGPWKNAIKIATHADPQGDLGGSYSFYNPTQLPFFDEEGGRIIYFQGTYSTNFFDSAPPTPLYEYNQITYRLDLATIPQLSADVLAADFNADGLVDSYDLESWTSAYGMDDGGDTNGDSVTDGADFLLWQRQLGSHIWASMPFANSVVVPEPTAVRLAVFCFLIGAFYRIFHVDPL